MGGTTVSVNRIYDSRNKSRGDFGIGWTLGISGMEIYENHFIGDGYEMVKTGSLFSTGYQMTETENHDVTIEDLPLWRMLMVTRHPIHIPLMEN